MSGKSRWIALASAVGALACHAAVAPARQSAPPEASASRAAAGQQPASSAAAGASPANPSTPVERSIHVRVDPQVELLCVLARLAGFEEYSVPHDYAYARDAEQRFAPFAEHDAVRTLRLLRFLKGVSHDAVINMAVHLGELPELAERGTWDGEGRSLDRRWPLAEARRFREQARRFAAESDFAGFLDGNVAFYAEAEERFRALLARRDVLGWLDAFFGIPPGMEFQASPGLLTGASGYASTVHENEPGAKRVCQVIGVTSSDEHGLPLFEEASLGTVVHEYCHAFANPLVDAHAAELEGPCQRLFPFVEPAMRAQAYTNWRVMMAESLVRASCTRFWPAGPRREAAIARETEQCGFRWTRELSDALGEYEADRERYPTLEVLVPRIAVVMEAAATRQAEQAAAAEEHRRAWRQRTPELSPELEQEVEHGLADALIRIERALAAPDEPGGPDARARVRESLRLVRFKRDVQVTVLDARGKFVFHVQDLTGSAYGHTDVHGEPVYRRLSEASTREGLTRNFDFVSADGTKVRANAIAWRRMAEPAWLVCVEGHEWKAR